MRDGDWSRALRALEAWIAPARWSGALGYEPLGARMNLATVAVILGTFAVNLRQSLTGCLVMLAALISGVVGYG